MYDLVLAVCAAEGGRFAGALAVDHGHVWVVVEEVDPGSAEVVLAEVRRRRLRERARLAGGAGRMPFAYAATVGGDGAVWIGGAWWTAGPGTREAFVARWDGERLGEVGTTPESGRARIVDATPTAAGARFSGVGTDATGVARTAVWDAGPAGVTVRLGEEIGPMPKPPPPPAPFDRTPPPGFVEVPHRWAADGAGALWLATTVSAADGGGPPGLRLYRWRPDTDGGPRDTRRATKSCRSREPSVSFEATDG